MARHYLCDCYRHAEIECQMVRMQLAAERLVTASRLEIELVAAALLRRGSLSGDEIVELLDDRLLPRW